MKTSCQKSTLPALVAFLFFLGCDGKAGIGVGNRIVPVPPSQIAPFSYQGKIGRIWGGDNFEVVHDNKVHFVYLRGIDSPAPGQFGRDLAEAKTSSLAKGKTVTVNVIEHDAWMCEVSDVMIPGENPDQPIDLGQALLAAGLAWFDNSSGPYSENYRAAQAQAREKRIGIWSQKNPTPPWEAWKESQQAMQKSLIADKESK